MENDNTKKIFGERLQRVRKNHGWTKQALAEMVGVSDVAIGYFEHGKRWPAVPTLIALAEALGCSLDWLCGLTERPERYTDPSDATV